MISGRKQREEDQETRLLPIGSTLLQQGQPSIVVHPSDDQMDVDAPPSRPLSLLHQPIEMSSQLFEYERMHRKLFPQVRIVNHDALGHNVI